MTTEKPGLSDNNNKATEYYGEPIHKQSCKAHNKLPYLFWQKQEREIAAKKKCSNKCACVQNGQSSLFLAVSRCKTELVKYICDVGGEELLLVPHELVSLWRALSEQAEQMSLLDCSLHQQKIVRYYPW
jgi:hypothetical protein